MTPQQEENQQSIIKRAEAIGLSFMERKRQLYKPYPCPWTMRYSVHL